MSTNELKNLRFETGDYIELSSPVIGIYKVVGIGERYTKDEKTRVLLELYDSYYAIDCEKMQIENVYSFKSVAFKNNDKWSWSSKL